MIGVEALAVAVFPRRARLDVGRHRSCIRQPLAQIVSHELWPIVRAKMLGHALHHHHIGQRLDHLRTRPPAFGVDEQALPVVFVDQVQYPYRSSVVCLRTHEVVASHVVAMRRPQANIGAVVEPETAARLLPLWHLQAFASPYPLHTILADAPTGMHQERRDAAVTISAILAGKIDDRQSQRIFVFPLGRPITLRATRLVHQTARRRSLSP
jgi:hypothetical protein